MLTFVFFLTSLAQRYPFRIYNTKEGMSQSQIIDMVQDNDGYLWYATAEGVTRFNGHEFRNFGKSDGLAGPFINKILLDKEGDFWFGHRFSGISRYLVKEKIRIFGGVC